MGVLMQVHLAARQYDTSLRLFERAHAIWDVDNRLMDLAQAGEQAKMQSQQALISTRTTTILSLLRRYQALASVHESASKLHATLGLEPEIGSLDDISLPDLTGQIEKTLSGAVGQVAAEAPAALAPQVSSEVAPQAAPVAAAVASSDQLRSDSLPVPRAPTSATVPVTPARAGDWIVVLGAHRNSGHAMDIARHTRALGLPVFIEDATDGQQKRTKVRAGPFADKDAAEAALLQLTQKGHAGQVRRY
jgi:cell division septation protein DedD